MSKRNRGAYLKWFESRNSWYVFWYEGGRERKKSAGTSDRVEAEHALSRHLIEKDQPTDVVSANRRNLADVLVAYAQEHLVHTVSQEASGNNIKSLIPFWGHRTVADVRPVLCREYLEYRRKEAKRLDKSASDALVSRELGVLAAAINHDYKQGRIPAPVPMWKPPPAAPKDRWLTKDEVVRLLKTARSKQRVNSLTGELRPHSYATWHVSFFILMALYTAARKEALLTLQWKQVDLDRQIIDLNKPGAKISNKRRAIIPIPNKLMTFLLIAKRRAQPRSGDEYVIEFRGQPMLRIDQAFRRVSRDAGFTDVTPHTLRHTAATWMAQAGVPLWVISKYLGHTSTRTTERIYAHHNPSFLAEARDAMDRKDLRALKEDFGPSRPRLKKPSETPTL